MRIMIVESHYYRAQAFAEELRLLLGEDDDIEVVYRTYHAESMVNQYDIVIGDGVCRTRLDGMSVDVYFSSKRLAKKAGKSYIPLAFLRLGLKSNNTEGHIPAFLRRFNQAHLIRIGRDLPIPVVRYRYTPNEVADMIFRLSISK